MMIDFFQCTWLTTVHLAAAVPYCWIIAFAVSIYRSAYDTKNVLNYYYLCVVGLVTKVNTFQDAEL